MKIQPSATLEAIAGIIGAKMVGDPSHEVSGINEIHVVEKGDLVFVDHPKYYKKALESNATTILIDKEVDCPEGKALLIHEKPFDAFNALTKHFRPFQPRTSTHTSHKTGFGTVIEPGAILADDVEIGENCLIRSGVVINAGARIGNNVIIHPNSVIGGEAFYYQKKNDVYHKMHTCGHVIIEDDVEVGALCSIDLGVTGDTIVGQGTKIDNQVHIGHDTVIGKNCLFAAHVGISGCVTIEDNVTLWGQVGVISDVRIGKGAAVLGQAGVGKDLEPGKSYLGSPADEARRKFREIASVRLLPEIIEKLNS